MRRQAPEDYLKTFGYPYDVRCMVKSIEGVCPAGYEAGDYFDYNHGTMKLDGPKGVCLHCLLHSGVLRIIEHIRGKDWPTHMDRGTRTADGRLTFRKVCQCQGPEGPSIYWEAERVESEGKGD